MISQASAPPRQISLRLRRRFDRPPDAVFRAWTDPECLSRWWCPPGWAPTEMKIDLRVGGLYRLGMRRQDGERAVYVYGRFLEVSAPYKLIYTWNWENAFEQMPETQVTVRFTGSEGSTELELTHEALPAIPICVRHRTGWLEAWERLRTIALRGI